MRDRRLPWAAISIPLCPVHLGSAPYVAALPSPMKRLRRPVHLGSASYVAALPSPMKRLRRSVCCDFVATLPSNIIPYPPTPQQPQHTNAPTTNP